MNTITLVCKNVSFYSEMDEALFFNWLEKVSAIVHIEGVGDQLHLRVEDNLSDQDLREIIALFTRYDIDMIQLKQLESSSNASWFTNKNAYWYSSIFE